VNNLIERRSGFPFFTSNKKLASHSGIPTLAYFEAMNNQVSVTRDVKSRLDKRKGSSSSLYTRPSHLIDFGIPRRQPAANTPFSSSSRSCSSSINTSSVRRKGTRTFGRLSRCTGFPLSQIAGTNPGPPPPTDHRSLRRIAFSEHNQAYQTGFQISTPVRRTYPPIDVGTGTVYLDGHSSFR
jgi:hypothetical protein